MCKWNARPFERAFGINSATTILTFAAYAGTTPELCEILIKSGASRKHISGGGVHFEPQRASSWRAVSRASADGPFGTARLGMLTFAFPELVVRYKKPFGASVVG